MCVDRHWAKLLQNTKNKKKLVPFLNAMGVFSVLLRRELKKTQQTGVVLVPKLQRTYRIRIPYLLLGKSFKHGWQIHQKQGWSMEFWWFSASTCTSLGQEPLETSVACSRWLLVPMSFTAMPKDLPGMFRDSAQHGCPFQDYLLFLLVKLEALSKHVFL